MAFQVLSVLGNRDLDIVAFFLRSALLLVFIMTLFVVLCVAFLIVLGRALVIILCVALLLILSVAFLVVNIVALLLWLVARSEDLFQVALLLTVLVALPIRNSLTLLPVDIINLKLRLKYKTRFIDTNFYWGGGDLFVKKNKKYKN